MCCRSIFLLFLLLRLGEPPIQNVAWGPPSKGQPRDAPLELPFKVRERLRAPEVFPMSFSTPKEVVSSSLLLRPVSSLGRAFDSRYPRYEDSSVQYPDQNRSRGAKPYPVNFLDRMTPFTLSAYPNDRMRRDTANLRFFNFIFDTGISEIIRRYHMKR